MISCLAVLAVFLVTACNAVVPIVFLPPAPPTAPADDHLFGVSVAAHLYLLDPAAQNAALDDLATLGVNAMRMDLNWDVVAEAGPAYRNWAVYDRLIAAARVRNIKVLAVLIGTPAWARPSGCSDFHCAPADYDAFAGFAAEAVARYSGNGVVAWEVWNEPNDVGRWHPRPNVAAYADLLAVTADAIHAVNPNATVMNGGLAPHATAGGHIAQLEYLAGLCSSGALSKIDAIAYHPYSFPAPPSYVAPWNAWSMMGDASPGFKTVLPACGEQDKPLWLTEYGAPTGGPGAIATVSNYNFAAAPDHVDEALQAQMVRESFQRVKSSIQMRAIFWYTWRDLGTNPASQENFFGLHRFDGSAKPAWTALRDQLHS